MRGGGVAGEDVCVAGVVRDGVLRPLMRAWRGCCGTYKSTTNPLKFNNN